MAGAAGNPARGSTEGRAFRRVVLKLSGEVLAGEDKQGINVKIIRGLAEEIRDIHREGVEMAIVIGGGNIFRGVKAASDGMDRAIGDYMGMMATVINGLALQDFLEKEGLTTRLQTAIEIKSVAEPFIRRKAIRHLEKKPADPVGWIQKTMLPHIQRYRKDLTQAFPVRFFLFLLPLLVPCVSL